MGGRRGGHASLSAAGSSASALGPSSVRSTGLDVPVGAGKRIEPSSLCHVYTETPGPTSILVTSESTPLQIFSRFSLMKFGNYWSLRLIALLPRFVELLPELVPGVMVLRRK